MPEPLGTPAKIPEFAYARLLFQLAPYVLEEEWSPTDSTWFECRLESAPGYCGRAREELAAFGLAEFDGWHRFRITRRGWAVLRF